MEVFAFYVSEDHMNKIALAILLTVTGLAHAQEQSAEGAQEFLRQMLPDLKVSARDWNPPAGDRGMIEFRFALPSSVETLSRCVTQITLEYPRHGWTAALIDGGGPRSLPPATVDLVLDFGKVRQVTKKTGGDIEIAISGNQGPVKIKAESTTLQARLAYALEFLRTKCDKASSTGF
jgi:hypothetical protein